MPVTTLHCADCGSDFIDSRKAIVEGDEAICPKCGARNEFTRDFAEAQRRVAVDANVDSPVAHSGPETETPR